MKQDSLEYVDYIRYTVYNTVKLLIEAGSHIEAGSLIQAGGRSKMFQ